VPTRKFKYTAHLKLRLKLRKIPEKYPEIIYQKREQTYCDRDTHKMIAIKKLHYNSKRRNMMLVYEEKGLNVEFITIHPMTNEKIINRVSKGRWVVK